MMKDHEVDQLITFVLVHYNAYLYKKADQDKLRKEDLTMKTLNEFHNEFDKLMDKYKQKQENEKPI